MGVNMMMLFETERERQQDGVSERTRDEEMHMVLQALNNVL